MCYTIFVGVYPIYYKLEGITMYYIYTCFYRSVLPVTSPLDVAEWFEPDEAVEFSSDVLDDVIEMNKAFFSGNGNVSYTQDGKYTIDGGNKYYVPFHHTIVFSSYYI